MPKPPGKLQQWLSHLIEWPVAELTSQHNEHLKIVLHRGRYKLITDGAVYSYGDLYTNYRRSSEKLTWQSHDFKTCLILGLGLASIPDMLVTRFQKDIEFTAVEIDEVVTRLAFDYVLTPKKIRVQVFTSDAADFLEWHEGQYDMICADVFVGDTIPEDLETIEALTSMRNLLAPGGVLLYNRLSRTRKDIDNSLKFRDEVFMKAFPEGGYLDVWGNWMFVSQVSYFK